MGIKPIETKELKEKNSKRKTKIQLFVVAIIWITLILVAGLFVISFFGK